MRSGGPTPRRLIPMLELEFSDPAEALGRALAASDSDDGGDTWGRAVGLHHELLTRAGRFDLPDPGVSGPHALEERGVFSSHEVDSLLFLHLVAVPTAGGPVDRAAVEWLGHCVEAAVLGGWHPERIRWVAALFCELYEALETTWMLDTASSAIDVGDDVAAHNRRILERCMGRLPSSQLGADGSPVLLDARPEAVWWHGRHPDADHVPDLAWQAEASGHAAPLVGVLNRGPDPLSVSPIVLDVAEIDRDRLVGIDRVSGAAIRLLIGDADPNDLDTDDARDDGDDDPESGW